MFQSLSRHRSVDERGNVRTVSAVGNVSWLIDAVPKWLIYKYNGNTFWISNSVFGLSPIRVKNIKFRLIRKYLLQKSLLFYLLIYGFFLGTLSWKLLFRKIRWHNWGWTFLSNIFDIILENIGIDIGFFFTSRIIIFCSFSVYFLGRFE